MQWLLENMKVIGSCFAALTAVCTGYVTIGGPIPASRQYVIAQADQLKERLIENSLQTNRLQLDLLRKEQVDRSIQIQQEANPQVKMIYQDRMNTVTDGINATINKNNELEKEKQNIISGYVK